MSIENFDAIGSRAVHEVGRCEKCRTSFLSKLEIFRITLNVPKAGLGLLDKDTSYALCRKCWEQTVTGIRKIIFGGK